MDKLHYIQIQILKKLLFSSKLRYTDLRPSEDIENNSLNFHLNQLKDLGLISNDDKYYSLTSKGKELAGRLDTEKLSVQRQAKISSAVYCIRGEVENMEVLIYTRLKHPFYGCQGGLTGKVAYGETVKDSTSRELKEECGLIGEPVLLEIRHYLVKDAKGEELLEDKFIYFHVVKNPTGELFQSEEGKYEWVAEKDLKTYVTNPFESWEDFSRQIELIKTFKGSPTFTEEVHFSSKF